MAEGNSNVPFVGFQEKPYIREIERHILPLVYAGKFEIDDDGQVWRLQKDGTRTRAENKTSSYFQVRAMIKGVRYHASAHRLVWAYFNGPIPKGMVVNHKNGNKLDNRPSNLEVVSPSDNSKHAHRTGLIDQRGERNPIAKVSNADVARIRLEYASGGVTQEDLAKQYGVSYQTISEYVRGNTRRSQLGPVGDYTSMRQRSLVRDEVTGQFLSGPSGRD